MGYRGLVVGERDVAMGLPFLEQAAGEAHLPLLSANLEDARGKPLFQGHLAFDDGPLHLCAVFLSPAGDYGPDVHREDPIAAAKRELSAFATEPCDAHVLLANLPATEIEQILKENPGFEVVAQAHEGWQSDPQPVDGIPVVHAGQRGRVLEKLELSVVKPGSGPFVDVGAADRVKGEVTQLDGQIQAVKRQIDEAQAPLVKPMRARLELLERRRAELSAQAKTASHPSRTLRGSYVTLDPKVADDPAVAKLVSGYLAKYPDGPSASPPVRPWAGGPGRPMPPHPVVPFPGARGARLGPTMAAQANQPAR